MPRYNTAGTRISTGFMRDWYDNDRLILQDCSEPQPPSDERWTGWPCRIALDDGTVLAKHGAQPVVACGARFWAAWWSRDTGAFDADGRSFPLSGPPIVGPDDAIVVKDDYYSYGPFSVIERGYDPKNPATSHLRWLLTTEDGAAFQLLGNRRAIWVDRWGQLQTTPDLPLLNPRRPLWWPWVREIDGRLMLLYQDQATQQLVLDGHVVGEAGIYFRADFKWVPALRSIEIVWSTRDNYEELDAYAYRTLTLEELATLPRVGAPKPPDPPDPGPEPPEPGPEPPEPEPGPGPTPPRRSI